MPGFIDTHIHAPQFAQNGLGLDMELLDWLNTYTFPLESKFADKDFAAFIYKNVVVCFFSLNIILRVIKRNLDDLLLYSRKPPYLLEQQWHHILEPTIGKAL